MILLNEDKVLELVRVRFPGQTKPQSFNLGKLPFKYGEKVVAQSERGMTIGYIHSFPFVIKAKDDFKNITYIERYASVEDIVFYKAAYQDQRFAKNIFNDLVSKLGLTMMLEDIEFTSLGSKIIFYFHAPTRVDFRELLKELNQKLKLKIELRQIFVGGGDLNDIGPCGAELCQFINSVMETGCKKSKKCNEYKCRLDYNDPFYEDKRSRLPKVGQRIETHSNEFGRVTRLDLWNEEFELIDDLGQTKKFISELWKH